MTRSEAIVDLITLFCGDEPPFPIEVKRLRELKDEDYETLQNFVANRVKRQWLTGIDVLECIDQLIDGSINNSERDFLLDEPYYRKPLSCRVGDAVRIQRGKKTTTGIVTAQIRAMGKHEVVLRAGNGTVTNVSSLDIIEVLQARR